MKKKILLTAAGTATVWHFCNVIKEYFDNDYEIYLTDTNDSYLVPASIFCEKIFKVPSIYDDNYLDAMHEIIEKEKIDIIVPLIDFDLFNFSYDDAFLKDKGVLSSAPVLSTTKMLTNKYEMSTFLLNNGINTPHIYSKNELSDEEYYIVKPKTGFGSINVKKMLGSEIKNNLIDDEKFIIQELCDSEEVTAEVYNGNELHIFQRERVATKSGVCVKAVKVDYEEINNAIKKLVSIIDCPLAFNIQFLKNREGHWCVVDCNLRIGAGTAMTTKFGFQLVRAFLINMLDKEVDDNLFTVDNSIKSVLRVYDEVVIK